MNFKTLNYIHQLLVAEESRRRIAATLARDVMNRAEDEGSRDLSKLKAAYEEARDARDDAADALREFEAKEWS